MHLAECTHCYGQGHRLKSPSLAKRDVGEGIVISYGAVLKCLLFLSVLIPLFYCLSPVSLCLYTKEQSQKNKRLPGTVVTIQAVVPSNDPGSKRKRGKKKKEKERKNSEGCTRLVHILGSTRPHVRIQVQSPAPHLW